MALAPISIYLGWVMVTGGPIKVYMGLQQTLIHFFSIYFIEGNYITRYGKNYEILLSRLNSSGERGQACLVPLWRRNSSERRPAATSLAMGDV